MVVVWLKQSYGGSVVEKSYGGSVVEKSYGGSVVETKLWWQCG